MASSQLLDVKTDADYIALRRRISRLRVQNSNHTEDDDDDNDELSDEMLKDLIKYWKKNNTDIAKRFIQTRKERRAKNKANSLAPGTSGRRKSVEFEDLHMTKAGLRLKTHEPMHTSKAMTRISETTEGTGSDDCLSVRRPRKTTNEQKMNMILNRASTKSEMSKAEQQIIKSKLASVTNKSPPLERANSSIGFRPRVGSGSTADFRKRLGSDSNNFRPRSGSGSSKDLKKHSESSHDVVRDRSGSNSPKSPPESRKQRSNNNKRAVIKQTSMPTVTITTP